MPRSIRTKPRKHPKQERSRETVEAILTATAHILIKEGYDTASTNKIAERAGVSIGSLYQYFPSKEAIVATLIEHHAQKMISVIEARLELVSDAPLEISLRELVKACVQANAINPNLHKVLIEQVPRVGQLEKVTEVEKQVTALIRRYLEEKRDQIQPQNLDLAAFILAHTLEALIHAAALGEPAFLVNEQFEQEVTTLLLRYLKCN
ncbi:TetR/AcrR family transcriptional regulator [Scytonema tolypothrichoides VB-61278]|nr:TetR/AcrR family transcriptional regulator [Scytonema tolypothrichoides VB-61278]